MWKQNRKAFLTRLEWKKKPSSCQGAAFIKHISHKSDTLVFDISSDTLCIWSWKNFYYDSDCIINSLAGEQSKVSSTEHLLQLETSSSIIGSNHELPPYLQFRIGGWGILYDDHVLRCPEDVQTSKLKKYICIRLRQTTRLRQLSRYNYTSSSSWEPG